jgi:hypothetical protein
MAITFVKSQQYFSLYRRPDGTEIALAHGETWTGVLFDYDDDVVTSLWQNFSSSLVRPGYRGRRRLAFLEVLRGKLIDSEMADNVKWCVRCEEPGDEENYSSVNGDDCDDFACDDCVSDYYYSCDYCNDLTTDTTETLGGSCVCEGCRDNDYSWCDDCEGYYRDGDSSEHQHDSGCGCESPATQFTVRNDGEQPLTNDTRVTVTLPAGCIDDVGMSRIRRLLMDRGMYDASYLVKEVGVQWQTKQGNFTKRLSRLVYNTLKQAIQPAELSQIGCIARDHSTAVDFHIETTRYLNMSAEDFYHEDSCWWQSYSESRCTLKSNGGFGLRSFSDSGEVTGRAWVMPLTGNSDHLTPTFETLAPEAFVVFNGYGDWSGYVPARIVSHMAGWTYRKITFGCALMFINSDSGYLIAPEKIAADYDDGRLTLSVDQHSSLFQSENASQKVLTYV